VGFYAIQGMVAFQINRWYYGTSLIIGEIAPKLIITTDYPKL